KQFESRAQFSTWLTRIEMDEGLARRRKQRPEEPLSMRYGAEEEAAEAVSSAEASPDRLAYSSELGRLIEDAVDALPESYRAVFMLREVEGLSTLETAEGLGLGEEAVKTRLHRARAMVRQTLSDRLGASASQAFQFHAPRCDRVVAAGLAGIVKPASRPHGAGPGRKGSPPVPVSLPVAAGHVILTSAPSRGSPYDTSIYQGRSDRGRSGLCICRHALEHAARRHRVLQERRRGDGEYRAVAGEATATAWLRRAEFDFRQERDARVPVQGAEQPRPFFGSRQRRRCDLQGHRSRHVQGRSRGGLERQALARRVSHRSERRDGEV